MRLLSSLRYPPGRGFDDGLTIVSSDGSPPYDIRSFSYGSTPEFIFPPASGPTVSGFFEQPRLGRVHFVDRVTVQPIRVRTLTNLSVTSAEFSINLQLALNDTYVSDISSIVYLLSPVGVEELTLQNSPIAIQPYNQVELLSGDQLRIEFSCGYQGSGLVVNGDYVDIKADFNLSAVGRNEKSDNSRV